MLFWIGFTLMVLNEGFVIMRHVHPWFANKRDQLIETYGPKWKKFHATLDYAWIGGVTAGILIDLDNWKTYVAALGIFWGAVLLFVYMPKLYCKIHSRLIK